MLRILFFLLIILSTVTVMAQDEQVLYSFRTTNRKVVQLSLDEIDSIFIFRFMSGGRTRVEVRDDLRDADTIFTVYGYHRGGGAQNAAMDYNDVMFSAGGYEYAIYYVWAVSEEHPDQENDPVFGMTIYKDSEEVKEYKGKKILSGDIYGYSFYDILPVSGDNE